MAESVSTTSPTLLHLAAIGDSAAWDRLVALYGPLVFCWSNKQGLSEADSADVMQEVFTSVARNLERFEQRESASFRGWLWVVTRNQLVDYFRRKSRSLDAAGGSDAWHRLAEHAESLPDDPDDFTEARHLNALHRRGLELVQSEFEQRTWAIFQRVVIDEVSTSDAATEFGITANSVRQAKSRVLRRLRDVLGEG